MLDGIHRITIAKILGLKKVPVIVNLWHEEFYRNASKKIAGNKMTPKYLAKTIIEETSVPIQTGALPF